VDQRVFECEAAVMEISQEYNALANELSTEQEAHMQALARLDSCSDTGIASRSRELALTILGRHCQIWQNSRTLRSLASWRHSHMDTKKISKLAKVIRLGAKAAELQMLVRAAISITEWRHCMAEARQAQLDSLLLPLILKHEPQTSLCDNMDCPSCNERIPTSDRWLEKVKLFRRKRCSYTSQRYCRGCHHGKTHAIPARILHLWDFQPFPVSDMAHEFLGSIQDLPLLDLKALNQSLLLKPELQRVAVLREEVSHLYTQVCQSNGIIDPEQRAMLMATFAGREHIVTGSPKMWCLSALAEVQSGQLESNLQGLKDAFESCLISDRGVIYQAI